MSRSSFPVRATAYDGDGALRGYNVNVYRRVVYRYELICGMSIRAYICTYRRASSEFSDSAVKAGGRRKRIAVNLTFGR